jgi:hypothetical protein
MLKKLQKIGFLFLIFISGAMAADSKVTGEYGIHLFFNETEFIDTMTISQNEEGKLLGEMLVPNDFDGKLENIHLKGKSIRFDLFVPKNTSRPKDLIFHYEGVFHAKDYKQIIGFVTLKGQTDFVCSFTGFKR